MPHPTRSRLLPAAVLGSLLATTSLFVALTCAASPDMGPSLPTFPDLTFPAPDMSMPNSLRADGGLTRM